MLLWSCDAEVWELFLQLFFSRSMTIQWLSSWPTVWFVWFSHKHFPGFKRWPKISFSYFTETRSSLFSYFKTFETFQASKLTKPSAERQEPETHPPVFPQRQLPNNWSNTESISSRLALLQRPLQLNGHNSLTMRQINRTAGELSHHKMYYCLYGE